MIFEPGTDPNEAVVRVKTRVDQVMPNLPVLVQRGRHHHARAAQHAHVREPVRGWRRRRPAVPVQLCHTQLLPEIQRVPGVAQAQILGAGSTPCASG